MKARIQEYAKRLKLSWIREHYHEVNETDPETFLLKLFENEIQQREGEELTYCSKRQLCQTYLANPLIGKMFS